MSTSSPSVSPAAKMEDKDDGGGGGGDDEPKDASQCDLRTRIRLLQSKLHPTATCRTGGDGQRTSKKSSRSPSPIGSYDDDDDQADSLSLASSSSLSSSSSSGSSSSSSSSSYAPTPPPRFSSLGRPSEPASSQQVGPTTSNATQSDKEREQVTGFVPHAPVADRLDGRQQAQQVASNTQVASQSILSKTNLGPDNKWPLCRLSSNNSNYLEQQQRQGPSLPPHQRSQEKLQEPAKSHLNVVAQSNFVFKSRPLEQQQQQQVGRTDSSCSPSATSTSSSSALSLSSSSSSSPVSARHLNANQFPNPLALQPQQARRPPLVGAATSIRLQQEQSNSNCRPHPFALPPQGLPINLMGRQMGSTNGQQAQLANRRQPAPPVALQPHRQPQTSCNHCASPLSSCRCYLIDDNNPVALFAGHQFAGQPTCRPITKAIQLQQLGQIGQHHHQRQQPPATFVINNKPSSRHPIRGCPLPPLPTQVQRPPSTAPTPASQNPQQQQQRQVNCRPVTPVKPRNLLNSISSSSSSMSSLTSSISSCKSGQVTSQQTLSGHQQPALPPLPSAPAAPRKVSSLSDVRRRPQRVTRGWPLLF